MIDIGKLRDSFGGCTEYEVTAGCNAVNRAVEDYDAAKAYLGYIITSLLEANRYRTAARLLWGLELFDPRPSSVSKLLRTIEENPKVIVLGGGSMGKCMKKGTEITMSDGSVKTIENISVGDCVMGPDSLPRTVISTHSGMSQMFEIETSRGHGFVCNEGHIMTLVCTQRKKCGSGCWSTKHEVGKLIDVPLSEYLQWSKTRKALYQIPVRGWELPDKEVEFDPYIYGLWIGDGGVGNPVLHNVDDCLIDHWTAYWTRKGYEVVINRHVSGCHGYFVRYRETRATLKEISESSGVSVSTAQSILNAKRSVLRPSRKTTERVEEAVKELGYVRNPPTMMDVAKKAGVHCSSVDHVLSGRKFSSKEMRSRVTEAVNELGYGKQYPSLKDIAQHLRLSLQTVETALRPRRRSSLETKKMVQDTAINASYSTVHCHPFKDFLRKSYWNGEKRIRTEYLENSSDKRRSLLAGIIDTDGYSSPGGYGVMTKYKGLAKDIALLCSSLGLRAHVSKCIKGIKSTGFKGEYFRINISGDTVSIPCKIKKTNVPKKKKLDSTGFTVRPCGNDEYFGFSTDGDHRFVLANGLVVHNSYSVIAWLLLDWLRDPEYTGARIISTTSAHALSNTFSSLQRFYDEAIISLPGESQHGFIGLDPKDRHASLSIIAIKIGDSGKNSLQGFHPIRRRRPHPIFGKLSRIRLFLDEAELIPPGVWRGVGNLLGNLSGRDTVKAICATNPWDVTSILASNAEPARGHNRVDADSDKEWTSKTGWKTIRLDPADSENVKQKKEVYHGLMTWEGYENYRSKSGGEDPEYWCYARGMYPVQGSIECLIPLSFLDDFYGEFIFQPGTVVGVGGCDLAFEGGDEVIYFAGRYGRASAWRPAGSASVIQLVQPRYVVQLDQFRSLPKLRTEGQYNQIRQVSDAFDVSYDWLALDKTGVGKGVADLFYERGYRNVLAIAWGSGATQTKILDEDRHTADEVCDGISYEMFYALRQWLEFGFIKANPNIDMSKLQKELIGRKRKSSSLGPTGEPRFRLEKKEEFKARYSFSPDRADALVMCLHVARTRGPERARMSKRKRVQVVNGTFEEPTNISHIDFSTD